MEAVFLVEKDCGGRKSLLMDMHKKNEEHSSNAVVQSMRDKRQKHDLPTPAPSPDGRIYPVQSERVKDYVEVWDYIAGARFRGFVAENSGAQRDLFVFFDRAIIGQDLKPG